MTGRNTSMKASDRDLTKAQQRALASAVNSMRLEGIEPTEANIRDMASVIRGDVAADDVVREAVERHASLANA